MCKAVIKKFVHQYYIAATENIMNEADKTRYIYPLFLKSLESLVDSVGNSISFLRTSSLVVFERGTDYRSSSISKLLASISFCNSSFFRAMNLRFRATALLISKYWRGNIITIEADVILMRLWILKESYQVPKFF